MNIKKWEQCLYGGRMGIFKPANPSGTRDHPFRWIIQETLDLIPNGDYKDILDVGCGDGWSAHYLGERFPDAKVRGVTLSKQDKAMADERHREVEVTMADAHDLPYEDESQDVVIMRDSFEHMLAPFLVLEECCRVMRPNAWLFIAFPNEDWQDVVDHMMVPTDRQMLHLLKLAGLAVENFSRKTFPKEAALTELRYLCRKLEPADSCAVFSVPRSGTHMVMKLLEMFGMKGYWNAVGKEPEAVFDIPAKGRYVFAAHMNFQQKYGDLLTQNNLKGIYITRDPKDVAVSNTLSGAAKVNRKANDQDFQNTIRHLPKMFGDCDGWASHPSVYHVTYEALVGSKGGGDDEMQAKEIVAIHDHLTGPLEKKELSGIAAKLYGPGPWPGYFREGAIGTWKSYLSQHHVEMIERLMT